MTAAFSLSIGLSVLFSGHVAAADWVGPSTIWAEDGAVDATGLVALDNTTVAVAYSQRLTDGARDVWVRRSTDGGQAWAPPTRVSRPGTHSQTLGLGGIGGYGQSVDAVWLESTSGGYSQVRYARSTDGAATFTSSVALSKSDSVSVPVVARGPNGVVAVLWHSRTSSQVFIRVSKNGGQTFARRQALFATTEAFGYQRNFAVAVADGVIYVANSNAMGIEIRRSFDGSHWGRRTQVAWYRPELADIGYTWPVSLTAEGNQAFVGFIRYTKNGFTPSYRRTTDRGASWSARSSLAPRHPELKYMLLPLLSLRDGVVRTIFGVSEVLYRESHDGLTWTTAERVDANAFHPAPVGVGFTDRVVVVYDRPTYIEARTGTP